MLDMTVIADYDKLHDEHSLDEYTSDECTSDDSIPLSPLVLDPHSPNSDDVDSPTQVFNWDVHVFPKLKNSVHAVTIPNSLRTSATWKLSKIHQRSHQYRYFEEP